MDSINMSIHHAFKSTYQFENDNKNTNVNNTKGNNTIKGNTAKGNNTKDDFVEHEYLCSVLKDYHLNQTQ